MHEKPSEAEFRQLQKLVVPLTISRQMAEEIHTKYEQQDEAGKIYALTMGDHGEIKFKNGNHYKGDIANGLIHGQGTLFFKAQNMVYHGHFVANTIQKEGRLIYGDGKVYEGEFKDGQREGLGILYGSDGAVLYQGEWQDSKKHGIGK